MTIADVYNGARGHTKSMFRDHLLIADAFRRLGQPEMAKRHLLRSIQLHPHHPQSFRLMSSLVENETAALEWANGAEFIMNDAVDGFEDPYPAGHPLAIISK